MNSFGSTVATRRTVLAGAALAAMPLRRAAAAAADAISLRLDWLPHGSQAPFYLALQRGWYKDQGLDVSIEDGNGSATTVQLIGSGQFDVGYAALGPMALGIGKGLNVTSVAGFVQKGDTGILVPKNSGWTKPRDLLGKTWNYTAGSLEGPFMVPFLKLNGIRPEQVTLLNVAASAKLPVYVEGKSDAMVSIVPMNIPLLTTSRPSNGILFADYGLNLPGAGLVVNKATLARKGDAIRRFTSVVCAAWAFILNGHEQEAVNATLQYRPNSPMKAAALLQELDLYKPYLHTDSTRDAPVGVQAARDWAEVITGMANAGTIPADSKPEAMFTNDFIDQGIMKKIAGIG